MILKIVLAALCLSSAAFAQQTGGGGVPGTGGGGGSSLLSQKVVYTSKLGGVTGGVAVVPGSSATSTTDSATALNAAISGGNMDLEVDSGYALSTSLVLSSNTTIHCIAPQYGFIMQSAANAPVIINAHTNAPTTSNGTGGYVVSNIGDSNLAILGCTLNDNSAQSVTGNNILGVAHSATPGGSPTAKFVGGVEFYAVNGLRFENNEVYDSGDWAFFASNVQNVVNVGNYYHQPTPLVHRKFTAGYQIDGPAAFIYSARNHITAGDDSIAYNADDGQYPGTGDTNAPYIKSFVKWGDITDVLDTDEFLDNTFFGVRLLSVTSLMDRIQISRINGQACGNTGTFQAAYPSVGLGNYGAVRVDGWNLNTSGTCNDFSQAYNFNVSGNYQSLMLSGIKSTNPGVNWPLLTQTAGTIGALSLRDWDINTQTSGFSNVVSLTGGSIGQLAASGINWYDNTANASSFFSGTQVPSTITVSSYAGPNRLLASGFSPVVKNGDAFSNTYGITYVNTVFNEAASGTLVAGTTPATCANGCTGAWAASTGGPSGSAALTYGTGSASITGICTAGGPDIYCPVTVNPGVSNYTMRVTISAMDIGGGFGFVMRWTDQSNFTTWVEATASTWQLCDVVAGTTACKTAQSLGTGNGTYTIVMNGTTSSLSFNGSSISNTISASNTGGGAGINSNQSSYVAATTMTALSIKSL